MGLRILVPWKGFAVDGIDGWTSFLEFFENSRNEYYISYYSHAYYIKCRLELLLDIVVGVRVQCLLALAIS